MNRRRACWDGVLKSIVYLFSSSGFQRVCSFEYVYPSCWSYVQASPLCNGVDMEGGEITFTWLKKTQTCVLREVETGVRGFRLWTRIEKLMRQIKSVFCATGNGASHAADAAANTSGFLQLGFWRLKGGCGGIWKQTFEIEWLNVWHQPVMWSIKP